MITLEKNYIEQLEELKSQIQSSDTLAQYLDEEDESLYKAFQDEYESQIAGIYNTVAENNPLQLESLEAILLNQEFEGLFLPRILGFAVLRGELDEQLKYRKQQDHFKNILLAICQSANFEVIKKRIGQTIQVGFALSSDIWITNIINSIDNKKIKTYLLGHKLDKYRELSSRKALLANYQMQFEDANFRSTEFPKNAIELKSSFFALRSFIISRAAQSHDNSSLVKHMKTFISNTELFECKEFLELLIIIGLNYDLDKEVSTSYKKSINAVDKIDPNFSESFFAIYDKLYASKEFIIYPDNEQLLGSLLVEVKDNAISEYFEATNELHKKGFTSVDSIETVRKFYEKHPGMSLENDCLRSSVMSYIYKFISNLDPEFHNDYFEINKIVIVYIGIFGNERFNQEVKEVSMQFIRKCMKEFTDKRSKDYQDIKKYVAATFKDLRFLNEKEIVELFKTKRKPTNS